MITGGATTGAVQEDGTLSAAGTLTASDVDNGASLTWSVSGGVSVVPSDFEIGVDQLKITKGGSVVFEDNFNDGTPPPSLSNDAGTPFATSYGVQGSIVEAGGRAILDYATGVPSDFFGTPDPGVFNGFNLLSNVNPSDPVNGLKLATDFAVEARFDLSIPDDNREYYGIRLADRQIGGGGNPPDQLGDDVVDLLVRRDTAGVVTVTLREIDFVTETVTNLETIPLTPPPGADQITLRLTHVANAQTVQASFDYLSGGVVVGTQSFAGSATIFTNEIWTRAQIVASAPEQATSVLDADYGTPTIDQFGNWTYTLANDRTNVQALADGPDGNRHVHSPGDRRARGVCHPDRERHGHRQQRCPPHPIRVADPADAAELRRDQRQCTGRECDGAQRHRPDLVPRPRPDRHAHCDGNRARLGLSRRHDGVGHDRLHRRPRRIRHLELQRRRRRIGQPRAGPDAGAGLQSSPSTTAMAGPMRARCASISPAPTMRL